RSTSRSASPSKRSSTLPRPRRSDPPFRSPVRSKNMGDLKNPKLIYAKGFLFLALGFLSVGTLLMLHPDWRAAVLVALAVWAFARCYYFAFYVIERYVDPTFKFAGLGSFVTYLIRNVTARRRNSP